ncbi:hypothetical protein SAMN05444422_108193 [Halobiforma haloterrestris]|uniref:Halobacterial output domain-containing protein n=1 Tax=Natronobacterium haloterrestre TaxID=148448 RepID=A0A1I1J940_NATHA|nr:HalOD1 output domain-containing protein [Halobiforma haloterrestris]SFC44905.1 hypothetical protein SAMN05444422_108193 [Halobiforma haloterrestris]
MTGPIDSVDEDIVAQQRLETEQETPATQIVEIVAELEGADPMNVSPIYNCVDSLIADLFSSPPPEEADATVTFSYLGYRIRVEQDGTTTVFQGSEA